MLDDRNDASLTKTHIGRESAEDDAAADADDALPSE